jgi:YidC/Oxa1 family membrane protein insertase
MLNDIWTTLFFQPIHNALVYAYILTGSLGISIALVIILVRLLMSPMAIKQHNDLKKLQKVKPELEKIKEQYKNDAQARAKAESELYKKIGYNPIGCFVNFLIQIPFLAAIYQSIYTFTNHTPANMPNLYEYVRNALNALNISNFNTTLFGVDLINNVVGQINFANPAVAIAAILILALLAFSNFLPSYVNMKFLNPEAYKPKPKKDPKAEPTFEETFASSMNTSTLYVLPLMLTFSMSSLPTLISIYLILQNFLSLIQQILIKVVYDKIENKSTLATPKE